MSVEPCNARNRDWYRCELVRHDDSEPHWALGAGTWTETLTISGDAENVYLSDPDGRIVVTRRRRG